MFNKFKQYKNKVAKSYYASVGAALVLLSEGVLAAAGPDASKVNSSSKTIVDFIIAILGGATGYMLTLVAFAAGIFMYLQKQNFWAAMGCFGLAIAILVVPTALEGFFTIS